MCRTKLLFIAPLIAALAAPLLGCARTAEATAPLRLATTTSVDNTGLLAELLAPFEQRTGLKVNVLSVGTGQALALARRGDVDAVLVHAPEVEAAFMAEGHGSDRRTLMRNDFVLVGPADDPAGVRGEADVAVALQKIARASAPFMSRGDKSGTHMKEQTLWQQAGQKTAGAWYLESGQGQRMNLNVANEKQAYTLVDRATYVTARAQMKIEILVQGDARLNNPYSVMAVHPIKHPGVNHTAALALVAWLSSSEGQQLIGQFEHEGEALFHPVDRAAVAP